MGCTADPHSQAHAAPPLGGRLPGHFLTPLIATAAKWAVRGGARCHDSNHYGDFRAVASASKAYAARAVSFRNSGLDRVSAPKAGPRDQVIQTYDISESELKTEFGSLSIRTRPIATSRRLNKSTELLMSAYGE